MSVKRAFYTLPECLEKKKKNKLKYKMPVTIMLQVLQDQERQGNRFRTAIPFLTPGFAPKLCMQS